MNSPWDAFRKLTQARIGLRRAGDTVSTKEWLELQAAHAAARDAVRAPWNADALASALEAFVLRTNAGSREEFLLRPDRGRTVPAKELTKLPTGTGADIVFCVSDGLSAAAVDKHLLAFWRVFQPALSDAGLTLAPIVLLPFGRVAAADAVGHALGAKVSVIAVGERPGMSAADSLGLYVTYEPRPGRKDSDRNCLSNVRPPDGLSYELATRKLLFLLTESIRRKLSGVALKEESGLLP